MRNYYHRLISLFSFLLITWPLCNAQELVKCTTENEKYYFETTTDVAYGVPGSLLYKYGVTGWITFDNATFGDPVPGVVKSGYYVRTTSNSVRIYDNANYEGIYEDLSLLDVPTLGDRWTKKISSIQVPVEYIMIAYDDINFQGASIEIRGNWTLNPNNMQWNDRISSYKLVKKPNPVVSDNPPPLPAGIYARVFEHADFTGASKDFPYYDMLSALGEWNKKISAIQIRDGYRMIVYDNNNLQGNSTELNGKWSATSRMDWNDRISSFRMMDKNKTPVVNNDPNNNNKDIPEEISFQKQFVRMSTDGHGSNLRLDYSPTDKKFYLKPNSHNWKIVPMAPNKYKILLSVNGKYWALSSTPDAYPRLAEDTSGIYQFWQIERLTDGYYKISNWGLVQNNSPYTSLFCESVSKLLFLQKWEEPKTLNGRWSLLSAGNIPEGDQPDVLDKRSFTLISASNNKQMCLESYLMGGDVPMERIADCKGKSGFIYLIKTFNGDYFIGINNSSSPNRYYYLNDRLARMEESGVDAFKPDPKHTWKVKDTGYGVYIITNTGTKQVFNLSGSSLTLSLSANKNTEQWYLR